MNTLNNPELPIQQASQLPAAKKRSKTLLIIIALVAVLLCCLVVIVAFLLIDPFGWDLFSRGGEDVVAKVAPLDSTAYAGVNLQNLDTEKLQSLASVFEDAYQDYSGDSINTTEDLQKEINNTLEEFNITLEEDILPWIGDSAGFGLLDLDIDRYGNPVMANYFLAVEADDRDAADDFLLKLTDNISESQGVDIDTTEYQGTTIYIIDDPYEELAFARHGSLVIMANSEDSIKQVIDAEEGDSIADDPVYRNMIKQLPTERLFTFYLPGSALAELSQAAMESTGLYGTLVEDTYNNISGMAFSLAIVDAGVQFDAIMAYDPDKISASQKQLLETIGNTDEAADQLPGDTILYFSGQRLDLTWATSYEALGTSLGGDFEESLQMLEDEIGININTDFFPYLDGAYAIGVYPIDTGLLAENLDINLGLAFLAQTSNGDALLDTIHELNSSMEDLTGGAINDISTGDMTIYEVIDSWSEQAMFVYGVGSGWLGLSTSSEVLTALPNPDGALSDSQNFRQAQDYLPSGMDVIGYIDFKNGLDGIRNSLDGYDRESFDETTFFLKPIESLVVGSSPFKNNSVHSTLILVIPTER